MNCLNLDFKHYSLSQNTEMQSLFKFCKENHLHKPIIDEYSSRLHSLYINEATCSNVEAIIAFDKDKPIGITFVEGREQTDEKALNMLTGEQAPIYNLGFLHFYVNDMYRGLGIASELATRIEKQCLKKMHEITCNNLIIPLFVSIEGAFPIAQKNTVWTHIIKSDIHHGGRKTEIDMIFEDIESGKTTKLPLKDFFQKDSKNELISKKTDQEAISIKNNIKNIQRPLVSKNTEYQNTSTLKI